MENQRAAKRRREEEAEAEAAAGSIMEEDRISQLPEHILHHHILSLLPQKDAVGTCILSKSWRHLGPTRPKIEFHQFCLKSKEKFLSVVENTLQRYDEKNLSVQEFILTMWGSNKSNWLLKKWIVKLHMLKRLSLHQVYIEEETFEKIKSSCPLIQHLVLDCCKGLSSVKVSKARNLKHLDFSAPYKIDSIEINDDAPSLETIRITFCRNWYHRHHNNNNYYFFPRLKSLYLWNVHLATESFDNLSSNNCPCLENLQLLYCSGFTVFKLSSRSIKRLIIYASNTTPIEAAYFDVPNILYFEFEFRGLHLPSISFKTTSREWKSRIEVFGSSDSDADVSSLTWSLKLHEFLKALSQSQISLHISYLQLTYHQDTAYDDGGSCEPVVVEHLCLRKYYPSSQLGLLLNCVFRICRPRYVGVSLNSYSLESQVAEFLRETLVNKGETRQCHFWQQDLEESSIQVLDKNTKEWHDVQVCEFSNHEEIRLRFKWRNLIKLACLLA